MTRLKFDVTGVDPVGDFKVPKPGAYKARIDVVEHKESSQGNPMLEVQYVIVGDGEFNNSRIWDYYPMHVQWKLARFLTAVGVAGGKTDSDGKLSGRGAKGEFNTDSLVGKVVQIKTRIRPADEEAGYSERAEISNVIALRNGDEDVEDELEPDEGEDELEEDEDEDEGDEDEADYTYDDIQAMTKVQLRDLSKENELGIRVTKQSKLAALRDRVCEELGLEPEGGEDEDDEIEEVEDYSEAPIADLRNECKERGLSTKGTKAALVRRLEKDDEEGEPF